MTSTTDADLQRMTCAAIDRLLHHSHFLVLEGKTFRNPPPDRRAPTPAPPADE